jgi:dTDP-4-dehydrorhamnose reductase
MKIIITGAGGQLGKEFQNRLPSSWNIYPFTKQELNILEPDKTLEIIEAIKPDYIIHCAAYTAVDRCEDEVVQSFEVNSRGTYHVALAARNTEAKLVYISTDYVFDGKKNRPYEVKDSTNPLNQYGASKLLGEAITKMIQPNSYIIRTSWLYGRSGANFVKTMLRLAESGKVISVVNDQIGTPTYTKDVVDSVIKIFNKPHGIYHVTNSGKCSWYDFAKKIVQEAGYSGDIIVPITTKEFGAIAPRPTYSVLGHGSLEREGISPPRNWERAIEEFIKEMSVND